MTAAVTESPVAGAPVTPPDELELGPPAEPRRREPSMTRASVLLTAATLLASASNYLVNVVLARWMDPGEFGDANLIVTLMLIVTAVAVALQLTTARWVAIAAGTDRADHRRRLLRRAWHCGTAVALLLGVASEPLREVTSSTSWLPFVVLAAGLPLYLAQAVERGVLQGQLQFGALAWTFLAEAASRSVLTVGLVAAGFGVTGAALGLSASFAASWLVARRAGSPTVSTQDVEPALARDDATIVDRPVGVALPTAVLLVGQIVINNGDVVLAKALFAADVAGRYAVVALVGRAVFFLSWSVVTVAFPHASRGDAATARQAVRAVAAMSILLTLVVAVAGPTLVPIVFGDAYRSVGSLFAPYALATSLFAVANVMATLDVAAGRMRGAATVAAGAVFQTALLLGGADDAITMVHLQVLAMAAVTTAVWLRTRPRGAENLRCAPTHDRR